jgi:hypothetical protein
MTASDFAAIVRKGSDKLRVDGLVLNAGDLELHGKGMLRVGSEEVLLDMTLDPEEKAPPMRAGVYTKSDLWKLRGVIEDSLGFKCDFVGEGGRSSFESWGVHKVTLTFDLNPIDLIIVGWDAMSRDERSRLQNRLLEQHGVAQASALPGQPLAPEKPATATSAFRAQIANLPLPTLLCKGTDRVETSPYFGERRSGRLDTIVGGIEGYHYALIQEQHSKDVVVHLDTKEADYSPGEEQDWKRFYAFMNALAFMLGTHTWAYRTEYWREGKKLTDRIMPARRLPHTVHTPFRLHQFDFPEVARKATAFFEKDSVLSREVAHILFLFRQAADHKLVHGEITLLAACVLFESLVNQIFQGLNLEEKVSAKDPNVALFKEAKTEVCQYLKKQVASQGEGYHRLHNYVNSAQVHSFEQKLRAVTAWFALKWEGDTELSYQVWRDARHPMVHGGNRTGQSEADLKSSMLAESRIAGALNILVLKLIGYSGPMSASAFEEEYRQV